MKKLIIAIIMALPFTLFAQDTINPKPLGFNITNSQYFQTTQNEFIKGWNWGSPNFVF